MAYYQTSGQFGAAPYGQNGFKNMYVNNPMGQQSAFSLPPSGAYGPSGGQQMFNGPGGQSYTTRLQPGGVTANPYASGYDPSVLGFIPQMPQQDFTDYNTGGIDYDAWERYNNEYMQTVNAWMQNFQQPQQDWGQFWQGLPNFMQGLGGGSGSGAQANLTPPPSFNWDDIPSAPGVTAFNPSSGSQWSWQDFNTGTFNAPGAWTGNQYEPHADLQDVNAYVESLIPWADENRQKGFAGAGQRMGASGFAMSTPYAEALGGVERQTENDLNRLVQEAKMGAYENWAQRDLEAQQAGLGRDLSAWQTRGNWLTEGQLADLQRQFQANMARNELGLNNAMSNRDIELQRWITENQLASSNWANQAQMGMQQNTLENQLAFDQWAAQNGFNLDAAQLEQGNAQLNASNLQSLLPLLMQSFGSGTGVPWATGSGWGGAGGATGGAGGGLTSYPNVPNSNPPPRMLG